MNLEPNSQRAQGWRRGRGHELTCLPEEGRAVMVVEMPRYSSLFSGKQASHASAFDSTKLQAAPDCTPREKVRHFGGILGDRTEGAEGPLGDSRA